ncbi:BamA/TamA family outer membrane protein [Hymenobacter sp. GOD-10R]|uniref:translocation and assembly module lipoprotein TamL n=1 Tax=Hymenobacter sp. GOD-10R TaxID=3093922 RepID=UPI002D769D76|nr:BamA/TamA family outer membrane protein [Hymenobacter sp. GOD-10R]WRQ28684.1 BamA/TamA family outer membrane protein [Hymenobacter sp. GOD-10R]
MRPIQHLRFFLGTSSQWACNHLMLNTKNHTTSKRSGKQWLGLGLASLVLAGCSGTKFIPDDAKLYTGSTVKVKSQFPIKNESDLTTTLEAVIAPKPNSSLLGMRPKLYFWHMGVGKTKGLGHWLANKYGEEPVLLSKVDTNNVKGLMVNRLNNNGYFHPTVSSKVQVKDKTASVDYTATINKPYVIKEIHFPEPTSLVNRAIKGTETGSLLKVGDPYTLQTFVNERVRIDGVLKNQGYYYFSPDMILFQVDSTLDNQANVYLKIKDNTPAQATKPYILNRVTLNTDYSLADTASRGRQPILYRGYRYFPDESVFKAKAIINTVFLYPDSLYRRRRSDQTLSRLMSLGTFKFVDVRYRPARGAADSAGYGRLNAFVRMTQVPKKSLRAELQMNTSSIFAGPSFVLQYRNRSALRGAEQLLINANASLETGRGALSGVTSTQYGIDGQLLVPRLITPPFDIRLVNSDFQPRTFFNAGFKYVLRTDFFQQTVYNLGYGYSWKTKLTNEQQFQPIDLQYARLSTEPRFDRILAERPFLENSFRQQFILGSSYRYTYNQQVLEQQRNQIYFSGGLEVSGNLAYLLQNIGGATKEATADGRSAFALFGQQYSQYSKIDLEFRNYYRTSANASSGNKIATRLLIGAGLPYLNSNVMPYLRQYGIGGPNSVRAFNARGIGPGTYRSTDADRKSNNSYYDQVGDIRLEANVEYRQDLFPYVKGALFVDAGNVWLMNKDPSRVTYTVGEGGQAVPDGKNGQFQLNSFMKELAVGAGAGIRIDVQFFVIRLDAAYPLVYPYDNTATYTVGNDTYSEGNTGFKAVKLNVAIGYPF